ncbi:MAG: transposase, partial [Granulosicoccus sp.]
SLARPAARVRQQAIGKPRGGITTKILALTDAFGNLISFRLMPDQAHDLRKTAELIEGITCEMFLADRAFDANWLRGNLEASGVEPIIPPKSNRKFPPEFDKDSYKWRHLIENYFKKLKEFRRITLRACKADQSFSSMICLVAAIINSR